MIQSGGFLGRLFGPSLKTRLLLMKNLIKPLAKSILIPLGIKFLMPPELILKYKSIIRMSQDLMGFILKTVYQLK